MVTHPETNDDDDSDDVNYVDRNKHVTTKLNRQPT